jgi:hypothetical protein
VMPSWPEIYTTDEERKMTFEMAHALGKDPKRLRRARVHASRRAARYPTGASSVHRREGGGPVMAVDVRTLPWGGRHHMPDSGSSTKSAVALLLCSDWRLRSSLPTCGRAAIVQPARPPSAASARSRTIIASSILGPIA